MHSDFQNYLTECKGARDLARICAAFGTTISQNTVKTKGSLGGFNGYKIPPLKPPNYRILLRWNYRPNN